MSEVVVVFPDTESIKVSEGLTLDKKRELFDGFSGSVNRVIDLKETANAVSIIKETI